MKLFVNFFSEVRRRHVVPTLLPYMGLVWLLIQIASVLTEIFLWPFWITSLISIVLFAGFPVMAYLSWYFNFTLDGLERVPDTQGDVKPLGSLRWAGLITVLIVSTWMGHSFYTDISADLAKKQEGLNKEFIASSIAILPFRDQSPEQNQAYLGEGLAEEITNLLGKVTDLNIAASSSSLILSNKKLSPVDIGKRLAVDTVLTGSVRVNGNRLKLRTELIEVNTGATLWSESFSRKFTNIFDVEEEISRAVSNLMQDRYLEAGTVTVASKTASTDAYVINLKGREEYRKQTTESFKAARKYFEQAIALDPEYSIAYVGLADTILMLEKGSSRYGVLETDIAIRLAEEQLAKAFVREQNEPRAYAVQGKLFELKQDFDLALSSYDKAISLNPSLSLAHMWRSIVLFKMHQYDESMHALEQAYKLDPISVTNIYNLGIKLSRRGKFDKAENLFNELIQDFPKSPYGYRGLAHNSFTQGKLAQSAQQWRLAMQMSPQDDYYKSSYIKTLITLGMSAQVRQESDDPMYHASLLIIDNDLDTLFKEMDFQLAANPDDSWLEFEAGWYQLLLGVQDKGIDLVLRSVKGFSEEDIFAMPFCSPAIEVAWALQQQQNHQQAQPYIDRCNQQLTQAQQDNIIDSFEDYLSARLAMLNNNPELALQKLNLAINNGWREWWTAKDPILSDLSDFEEFNTLIAFIDSELASERKKATLLFETSEQQ